MAMPSGNVVVQDKMQFPNGGSGDGSHHQYRQQQWVVDERDGLIGWLRSEFAAANAIIDSLCHHLRLVGDPGEYDVVVGAIQQRRCNWNQVLLMQQYFSVAEVVYALQQVAWRKQQRYVDPVKVGPKEGRRFSSGYRHGQRFETAKESYNSSVDSYHHHNHHHQVNTVVTGSAEKGAPQIVKTEGLKSGAEVGKMDDKGLSSAEEKKDAITKHPTEDILKGSGSSEGSLSNSESEAVVINDGCVPKSKGNDSHCMQNQQSQSLSTVAKTFICNEMYDGKMVNVVDGLKLYEGLFDDTEVSKLVSLVNDLRFSGKRGQFQGSQTYLVARRPMKGHGREMIQLGIPVADALADGENMTGASKDINVEPIPPLFQDIIERLGSSQVMTSKPDACVVDFFNEGDHSQPNTWPAWFGRPVYVLFLTECEMTFGKILSSDNPGDYKGSLRLSLVPGSLLAMQGKSTDFARHALPSIRKQRILVTFTKSLPKKSLPNDGQRPTASSHWGPPPSRSSSSHNNRHHTGPKHYATVPTSGVLSAPPIRSAILPPNGMQPLFVAAPVVQPPISFAAPVPIPSGSAGWTGTPPSRHPPPRVLAPGTGVFLPPPGSGNNSSQQLPAATSTEVNQSVETPTILEKESGKSNDNFTSGSPKENEQRQECNGHGDGTQDAQAGEAPQESEEEKAVASQ